MPTATKTPVRAYGPALLPSSSATAYTVPAGKTAVIRHIRVSNPTAGAVTFTMSIGTDAAGTRLVSGRSIAAGGDYDHIGYWVLNPGDILAVNASSGAALVMAVFGDEYGGGTGQVGTRVQTSGVAATSVGIVSATTVGTNTPNGYFEVISAAAFTAEVLNLQMTGVVVSGANTSTLVTVAFGAVGVEVDQFTLAMGGRNQPRWTIPYRVPIGTRISVKTQSAVGGQATSASIELHEEGMSDSVPTSAQNIGLGATSNGTVLTTVAGTHAEGAWTQLIAATSGAIRWLVVCPTMLSATVTQDGNQLVDIGIGGSGVETSIIDNIITSTSSTEVVNVWGAGKAYRVAIPSGERVVARYQASTTNATAKVNISGVGLN